MKKRDGHAGVARCIAALLLLAPVGAAAQPQSALPDLNWVRLEGAGGCIGAQELAAKVEARLGRQAFVSPSDASWSIEGVASVVPGGFRIVLGVIDQRGVRELERVLPTEPDCRDLDTAVLLVLVMSLRGTGGGLALPPDIRRELDALFGKQAPSADDVLTSQSAAEVQGRGRAVAQAPQAPAPRQRAEPPPVLRAEDPSADLDLGAIGGLGVLPAPSLGFIASLGLMLPDVLRVALGLELWMARSLKAEAPSGGETRFELSQLSLALCRSLATELGLELCVVGKLGVARVVPAGFARNEGPETHVDPAAGIALGVQRPLWAPFYVRARATLAVPLLSRDYRYTGGSGEPVVLHSTPAMTGALEVALGVAFGL